MSAENLNNFFSNARTRITASAGVAKHAFHKVEQFSSQVGSHVSSQVGQVGSQVVQVGQFVAKSVTPREDLTAEEWEDGSDRLVGYPSFPPYSGGHLLLEVVRACNLSREGLGGRGYQVQARLCAQDGRLKGVRCRTPLRRNSGHPAWHSLRDLGANPDQGDILLFEVSDTTTSRVFTAVVGVHLLQEGVEVSLPLFQSLTRPQNAPALTVRRMPWRPVSRKKIFLIRHGESKWNEAQADLNLKNMLAFDHPLNTTGVRQAKDLRNSWMSASTSISNRTDPLKPYGLSSTGTATAKATTNSTNTTTTTTTTTNTAASFPPPPNYYPNPNTTTTTTAATATTTTATATNPPLFPSSFNPFMSTSTSTSATSTNPFDDPPTSSSAPPPLVDLLEKTENTSPPDPFVQGLDPFVSSADPFAASDPFETMRPMGDVLQQNQETVETADTNYVRGQLMRQPPKPQAPCQSFLDAFLAADGVFCSPLTRALQTALIALHSHPTLADKPIKLLPSAREVKAHLGGIDSVGKAVGEDIALRALEMLEKEMDSAVEARTYTEGTKLDVDEVRSDWWTSERDMDSENDLDERFKDFVSSIMYAPGSSYIVVGHSIFFMMFLRKYLGSAFKEAEATKDFAAMLQEKKLDNASCLAIDLQWSQNGEVEVSNAEFLFQSKFNS